MHMADTLLSPAVGGAFWAISGGAIAYSVRRLKGQIDDKRIPMMGVLGAFVFTAQMINFTVPGTGSSGHIGGGMILAILLGPYAGFITLASILIVQALFFGDGGLMALGCNIFNMGFWTCFVAYPLIYRRLVKRDSSPATMAVAAMISVIVAMQLGPFSVVIQTLISGISELPFRSFVLLMQPIHLAIGFVEGLVTSAFVAFVKRERPEILETTASKPMAKASIRTVFIGFAVAALVTGGILSWFASTHPDGLEWSISKIYGKTELPKPEKGVVSTLAEVQRKTNILPDYDFGQAEPGVDNPNKVEKKETWPSVSAGTTASGIVGAILVLALSSLVGLAIKRRVKSRLPQ